MTKKQIKKYSFLFVLLAITLFTNNRAFASVSYSQPYISGTPVVYSGTYLEYYHPADTSTFNVPQNFNRIRIKYIENINCADVGYTGYISGLTQNYFLNNPYATSYSNECDFSFYDGTNYNVTVPAGDYNFISDVGAVPYIVDGSTENAGFTYSGYNGSTGHETEKTAGGFAFILYLDDLGINSTYPSIINNFTNDSGVITTPDFFISHIKIPPDNTEVSSGYNYIGNDFNNINVSFTGKNQYGYYDHFYVDVFENGTKVVDNYSLPFSVSCLNCQLASFNMSDLGYTFRQGYNYLFNITYSSTLIDPIYQQFAISYNISMGEIQYETCDTADISCYMRNALKWAFTVPPASFDKWLTLKDDIQTKAPFGYITSAYNAITGINIAGAGDYTLEQVTPITNLIFTPIRTGISWLLYFLFVFGLIRRFKDIQI